MPTTYRCVARPLSSRIFTKPWRVLFKTHQGLCAPLQGKLRAERLKDDWILFVGLGSFEHLKLNHVEPIHMPEIRRHSLGLFVIQRELVIPPWPWNLPVLKPYQKPRRNGRPFRNWQSQFTQRRMSFGNTLSLAELNKIDLLPWLR